MMDAAVGSSTSIFHESTSTSTPSFSAPTPSFSPTSANAPSNAAGREGMRLMRSTTVPRGLASARRSTRGCGAGRSGGGAILRPLSSEPAAIL